MEADEIENTTYRAARDVKSRARKQALVL